MSNKIFDVVNKGGVGCFIAAPDEQTAVALAVQYGHGKKAEHLRAKDCMELLKGQLGIAEIIASDRTGHIVKELNVYTPQDVLNKVKKEPRGWRFA